MSKRIVFLFPGQGSQAVGMGKDFYEAFPAAKEVFEKGDEILGRELSKIMFEGDQEQLLQTRNSQAAIYINSMAILAVIEELFVQLKPMICAGHSLGEYSALTASKHLDFEACLPLVQLRSEAMNKACISKPGKMAALLGLDAASVEQLMGGIKDVWVANFNCPGQTVISGTAEGIEQAVAEAKQAGARRAIVLPVHGAFHSGLMQQAQDELEQKISQAPFVSSHIKLVMNVVGDFVSDPEKIRNHLIHQVTSPVRWEPGILKMDDVDLFIEIGQGKVLAGLNKKIGASAPTISIGQISDIELLKKELEA